MHVTFTNMQCDKNMQLVKAIEKFPCLYNYNLVEYLRKDVTDEAWNEVANQTQLSVTECKEKWKNLRYGLLRSLRLNADGTVKKKYYLHDEMEFVVPFIKTTKHETIIHPIEEIGIETNINDNDRDSFDATLCEDLEISEPPKKKSRSKYDTFIKKMQHNSDVNHDICVDPRKMFLLSLLPEINTLSEMQMRVFRRRVLALIDDIGNQPTQDMCLLEWQEAVTHLPENSQNNLIKKEPI